MTSEIAKLRWQCRRGMLELDLLLLPFLEQEFPKLSTEEQQIFTRLLTCTDPELFQWLMQHETPEDPELAKIVNRVIRI